MDDKELEKDNQSLYRYIGDITLAEKVHRITTVSVIIFIVAALVIVASIVLFFVLPDMLLVPTLTLVAGVIIALIAGLLRGVRGNKFEKQYKTLASINLGKEIFGNYETSTEEKYTNATNSSTRDQELYKSFKPIEFIILIHSHMAHVSSLSHDYKRKGYSYSLTFDNGSTHTITLNPLDSVESIVTDYLDSYVNKELIEDNRH